PRPADDADRAAAGVRVRDRELPRRPRPLLGHVQPVDDRPGADHAAADAEAGAADEAVVTDARARAGGGGEGGGREERRRREARPAGRSSQGQAEEESAPLVAEGEPRRVEATGETVGEAKWNALRELERLHPRVDKTAVEFQVVSEGERGLLGVGYAPARVVAVAPELDDEDGGVADESPLAADVRSIVVL